MGTTALQPGRFTTNRKGSTVQDRHGRRIPLTCRMFFFGEEDFEGEAMVLDASTSGCCATSRIEVNVGTVLKLSLFLSDYKWPLRVEESVVRWVDGERFGLEFTRIQPAQQERMRAVMMKSKS